jgi:DNA invertase Pin-like site-specific DNA recombinase
MTTDATGEPIGYSYIRFSSPEQAKGDSLRRQTEATAEWCRKNNVTLDANLSLRDLGVSAFKGVHRNSDKHALGQFLRLAQQGSIKAGSYLIIENLDRLSREEERAALRLWMDILDAGISIVQLRPETIFRHDKSDMIDIMRAIIELSRGHGESQRKSDLVGAAWAEKKARARRGEKQKKSKSVDRERKNLTSVLPSWVEEKDGELVLIPERAAVVKQIFHLAGAYGLRSTLRKLNRDGVPPFDGPWSGDHWSRTTVGRILRDRRALGEYQPRRYVSSGQRPADGPPIPNYYPAVVTEDEFHRARAGAEQRKRKAGRVNQARPNVFSGLLTSAIDGDPYHVQVRHEKGCQEPHYVLSTYKSGQGGGPARSFPLETFEAAVFSLLREIDPHDVLNGDHGPDESLTLAGKLAEAESSIALISADLEEHGDSPALFARLRKKEAEKAALAARLAEARQKATYPLSEVWGEAQTLLRSLQGAPDPADARLRLRSALRCIVESVWLVVVPRGHARLCAVQVFFNDKGRRRDYLILHRPAKANKSGRTPGGWWARSLASVVQPGDLDLRRRKDALALAEVLEGLDLKAITDDRP